MFSLNINVIFFNPLVVPQTPAYQLNNPLNRSMEYNKNKFNPRTERIEYYPNDLPAKSKVEVRIVSKEEERIYHPRPESATRAAARNYISQNPTQNISRQKDLPQTSSLKMRTEHESIEASDPITRKDEGSSQDYQYRPRYPYHSSHIMDREKEHVTRTSNDESIDYKPEPRHLHKPTEEHRSRSRHQDTDAQHGESRTTEKARIRDSDWRRPVRDQRDTRTRREAMGSATRPRVEYVSLG